MLSNVVLEKTLESPLDSKKIKPVEYSLEGLMLELKGQYIDCLMWRTYLIWKDPDAGKDWEQEEKRETEDEMVGWHHQLSGHVYSKLWETVKDREAWLVAVHGVTMVGHNLVTEQQQQILCSIFIKL